MDEHPSSDQDQRRGEQAFGTESATPPPPPPPPPIAWSQTPAKADSSSRKRWSSGAVILAATLGAIAGAVLASAAVMFVFGNIDSGGGAGDTVGLGTTRKQVLIATSTADVSEVVAAKVVPSIVAISNLQVVTNPFTGQKSTQEAGTGSGVFISRDGKIVTNNHVIEGADRLEVTVGVEKRQAKLVGTDPKTDLAVISIEGSGYPAIDFGSSSDLQVGEYVMAVGSPFGLEKTVTSGIVSALNRTDVEQSANSVTAYTNLIQTDAAINPGNSGGALVNASGELVGINTLIQSTSGSSAGIGFAIPSDFAREIAEQLIASGKATHAYLGVSADSINENIAREYGFGVPEGALVRYVQPNSPASEAGIKTGDIIVRIGRKEVTSVEDMFIGIRSYRVGEEVEVEIVRGKDRQVLKVTLGSDEAVR